jgi:hypothetical protein
MHTYIHTYTNICTHTYINACIHIYIHKYCHVFRSVTIDGVWVGERFIDHLMHTTRNYK